MLGVRELDQNGINGERPELAQPAHRLHARQRHHRGVRQPARRRQPDARRQPHSATTTAPSGPRATRPTRPTSATPSAGSRTGSTSVSSSPDYSVVGRARARAVELDLRRSTTAAEPVDGEDEEPAAAEGSEGTTTYDGAGGVPVGSTFRQLLYAIRFGSHELPAVRPGQREQRGDLPPRPDRAGAEGRALADHRRRRLPGDRPGEGGEEADRLGRRRLHRPPTGSRAPSASRSRR